MYLQSSRRSLLYIIQSTSTLLFEFGGLLNDLIDLRCDIYEIVSYITHKILNRPTDEDIDAICFVHPRSLI